MTVGSITARYAPQRFPGPLTVGESRDYAFDMAADLPAGSAITEVSLALAPSGDGEASIEAIGVVGTRATARIAAGVPRIVTALWTFDIDGGPPSGRRLEYVTEIAVNPRRPDEMAPAAISTDFGTPSVWTAS